MKQNLINFYHILFLYSDEISRRYIKYILRLPILKIKKSNKLIEGEGGHTVEGHAVTA